MKFLTTILLAILLALNVIWANSPKRINSSRSVFEKLGTDEMSYEAFDMAYKGWQALNDSLDLRNNVITVIDFSQPSTKKRLYLVDIYTQEVIYENYVAHGKNSGELLAKQFSNTLNSYQSSLGFYKTGEIYYGQHGLSLKLDGLEKGINDQARKRHIVIHAANYAEESFIKKHGRLGRSFGCPAVPADRYDELIETIKDGTLLFIYYPEQEYLQNSSLLN